MQNHRELLESCLSGNPLDRVPVALWRHFPVDDQTPAGLARAVLTFQNTFDFDLVKVTPASSYCLKDWGVQDQWNGDPEGTRDYTQAVILTPEDWAHLPILDPGKGHLAAQIECLKLLDKELGPGTPIIQTIFNPLSQAKNLVGKGQLLVHLRQHPEALHAGLKIIAESTRRFIEALKDTGVAGIFYAVQHAQLNLLSEAEYLTFGRDYDLQVLEPARDFWLNMLHLHGSDVMFDLFVDYPVHIINWHDRDTWPTLSQAKKRYNGVLCGGLQRIQTMVLGDKDQVLAEAKEALSQTGGEKFILGTGCVVPITTPYGNLLAARQALA
jgi:uroporphyrinogen decarboxylase